MRESSGDRRGRSLLCAALLVALVGLAAGGAEACPVCFQAKNDASRVAFIATTGFLTGLPLLLVGGVAWWLRRLFRRAAESEPARSAKVPRRESARSDGLATSI